MRIVRTDLNPLLVFGLTIFRKICKKTINLYRNNKKFENILISKFLNFTGYEKKKLYLKKHMDGNIHLITQFSF